MRPREIARLAFLLIGLPIAAVLFGIVMIVGLLVFGIPLLIVSGVAIGIAGVAWVIGGYVSFAYYLAREETHEKDPGNYSLDQTKSSDEK